MLRKTWVRILLVLLLAWLAVSAYFYTQHIITVRTYDIGRQMDLKGSVVNINQIRLENFESNAAFKNYGLTVAQFLPDDLKLPFVGFCHFYTHPYTYCEKGFAVVKLRGSIALNPSGDVERIKEDVFNKYDIDIINQVDVYFSSGRGYTRSDDSNTIDFEIRGSYFEMDSPHNRVLQIVATDKDTGEFQSLTIEPVWEKHTYDFFRRS